MKPISFSFGFSTSLFCGKKRVIFFKRLYPDHDNERHNNPEQTRVASWSAENAETISSVLKPGTLASISGVIDAANKKSSAIENLAALEGLQQGTF